MLKTRKKYMDVNIMAALYDIAAQNTAFFRSDLEVDARIISEAAKSNDRGDKVLLWLSRPSGTNCYKEYMVFMRDTASHNAWLYYTGQEEDRLHAYTIEVTGEANGVAIGNIYELDYREHGKAVLTKSVPVKEYLLVYENGEHRIPAGRYFSVGDDPVYGKFQYFEPVPEDADALGSVLMEQRRKRESLRAGMLSKHIAALRSELINTEAFRVTEALRDAGITENTQNDTIKVEFTPEFAKLATDKDMRRLFSLLPFKVRSYRMTEGNDRRNWEAKVQPRSKTAAMA